MSTHTMQDREEAVEVGNCGYFGPFAGQRQTSRQRPKRPGTFRLCFGLPGVISHQMAVYSLCREYGLDHMAITVGTTDCRSLRIDQTLVIL